MIGSTISQYRVFEKLERFDGAFVAEDVENRREVVIKLLPPELATQRAALERIEQAVRSLSELTRPGSTTVRGLVQADGQAFLVLDRAGAEPLLSELRELGRLLSDTPQRGAAPQSGTVTLAGTPADAVTLASLEETAPTGASTYAPGRMLGSRYRLIAKLGAGGMGEVWHAFDLKLQVEVALKALRRERFPDDASFELLRHEVRAGREVISPNVCRIYDLVEQEGQELLSMEYVDGHTLIGFLRERGPLDPREAGRIASQFLAGLEAVHDAGLVHRDIKPENVMITRTGRVVVMDFGIALALTTRQEEELAGTMPYMAPELLRGDAPDVRTDLYAAGVVLAEMIAPEGVGDHDARERVWQRVRETPPNLPNGAWKYVLERALAMAPAERFATSRELALALEAVTPRVVGADDSDPYPGLASFTGADAEYFYGREAEVEALWKRLQRSQLLAVIGASGAGKTSFLQAGVIPTRPEGWACVLCHPGTNPFLSLARALAPEFANEPEAVDTLLQFEDVDVAILLVQRWRRAHTDAVVIVDQFEELFTQCSEEARARFVWLLRRLALDADVRVLLSMRDDFLIQCQEHPLLAPIFAELTALGTLTGNALRRALVQPALACGYRFEDEELVEDVLDDVRGERGALPLLAFAMSRLWQHRDRETGRLTRAAYEKLGRVGGALAQHAEATLERIGPSREGMVRDFFRNLVTAQGTRAALTSEELVSVFAGEGEAQTQAAQEVLRSLVDARLLTTYDETVQDSEREHTRHRVEVVHESLFRSWPRLVRWRTQDAAGAQLRDQLRQAAQVWTERGRTDDLLWTGKAFREYLVWREDYPGGLTATEEAFAQAMVRTAERQRRRRRQVLTSSFVVLVAGLAVVVASLVRSQRAGRRARANELYAQAQLLPQHNASQRLAYAIAALELRDGPDLRRFALKSLWQGPIALVTSERRGFSIDFTLDGRQVVATPFDAPIRVWSSTGGPALLVEDSLLTDGEGYHQFAGDRDWIAGYQHQLDNKLRFWSYPDWQEIASLEFEGFTLTDLSPNRRYMVTRTDTQDDSELRTHLQVWSLAGRQPERLGSRSVDRIPVGGRAAFHAADFTSVDNAGTQVVYAAGTRLELLPVVGFGSALPVQLGRHESEIDGVTFHPDGERVLSVDTEGEIRVWSTKLRNGQPLRTFQGQRQIIVGFQFDPTGTRFGAPSRSGSVEIWDLSQSSQQQPMRLGWGPSHMSGIAFHPSGKWIATANIRTRVALWPIAREFPRIIRGRDAIADIAISPDGKWIASAGDDGVRLWSLEPGGSGDGELISDRRTARVRWDPQGQFLAVRGLGWVGVAVLSLVDGNVAEFGGPPTTTDVWNNFEYMELSPNGRFVAVEWVSLNRTEDARIHLYDRITGNVRVLRTGQYNGIGPFVFISDTELAHDIIPGCKGYVWDFEADTHVLQTFTAGYFDLSRDKKRIFSLCRGNVRAYDRVTGETKEVRSIQGRITAREFHPDGAFYVVGMQNGDLIVGSMSGAEPHVLPGHGGPVNRVRVDPKGRWIVSGGQDGTIRIWPIPQGRPLHTLPREDLLTTLRSLTNLRIVADAESSTGYRLDAEPFPGWEQTPAW